jgi:hypothetical protein
MSKVLEWIGTNDVIYKAIVGDKKMMCTAWLTQENKAGWHVGLTKKSKIGTAINVQFLAHGEADTVEEAMLEAEAYARAYALDLAYAFLQLSEVTK